MQYVEHVLMRDALLSRQHAELQSFEITKIPSVICTDGPRATLIMFQEQH